MRIEQATHKPLTFKRNNHYKNVTKIVKAIRGLALTLKYIKVLDADQFKGKRIAIVGPASSAYEEQNGAFIDDFDVVIRINKAPAVVREGKYDSFIGRKTDMLFHSFFENEESGGGPLNLALFDALGIKYLVNPRSTFDGQRNTFNFFKKYLTPRVVYTLPKSVYARICSPLKGFRPTIGFTALSYAIQDIEFSELFITGFTFYRTPFGKGYRDHMQTPEKVRSFMTNQGLHDVDLEFESFLKLLNSSGKKIVMDRALNGILKNL